MDRLSQSHASMSTNVDCHGLVSWSCMISSNNCLNKTKHGGYNVKPNESVSDSGSCSTLEEGKMGWFLLDSLWWFDLFLIHIQWYTKWAARCSRKSTMQSATEERRGNRPELVVSQPNLTPLNPGNIFKSTLTFWFQSQAKISLPNMKYWIHSMIHDGRYPTE